MKWESVGTSSYLHGNGDNSVNVSFFVGAVYLKINLCFVLSVLFFLLSHLLFQQCVSVPDVLLLQGSHMVEQMLLCRTVLWVALKVTHLLCLFLREKREIHALWEQHRRRVTAIREQRWQSAGPLSCNGLHCSLAGFQVGWYKYLSKPVKDQLVFIRLNETPLLAQESKQRVIELLQKVMFSAYLNTPLISDRDLCKSLTNNKFNFLFVVFSH